VAKSKPEDTKQKRGETEARAKWKVLSVRASRAPSRRVFAYRTREAYRHRLLCTGGMHTADIIFHRHRAQYMQRVSVTALPGLQTVTRNRASGNVGPADCDWCYHENRSRPRSDDLAGTTRLVKSTHRCGPNRPAGAPTRGGRGSGFEVDTAERCNIIRRGTSTGRYDDLETRDESRAVGEYLVSRFYFEILLHLCPSVSRRCLYWTSRSPLSCNCTAFAQAVQIEARVSGVRRSGGGTLVATPVP